MKSQITTHPGDRMGSEVAFTPAHGEKMIAVLTQSVMK
jgi:hypothetical protein